MFGHRASGKSTFYQAIKEMLRTPGYSTDEAAEAGGHDAYMAQKEKEPESMGRKVTSVVFDELSKFEYGGRLRPIPSDYVWTYVWTGREPDADILEAVESMKTVRGGLISADKIAAATITAEKLAERLIGMRVAEVNGPWSKEELIYKEKNEVTDQTILAKVSEADRAALCELINKAIQSEIAGVNAAVEAFELQEPVKLAVRRQARDHSSMAKETWSQHGHIGGEDFRVHGAYLGKRGEAIFIFRPLSPLPYFEAELSEGKARELLRGFPEWLMSVMAKPEIAEFVNGAYERRRQSEFQTGVEAYGEDFGAW